MGERCWHTTLHGEGKPAGTGDALSAPSGQQKPEGGQAALEAERQQLYAVLDTLPVYVVLLSEDHHVPFANRFFRERFGESGGKRCYEYLFGRDAPCDNCETYKVLRTGAPHHGEWTGPDGRNYDIHDYPFRDTDGSRLIMKVGIDITEQKKARAEMERHRHSLESLVAERTRGLEERESVLRSFFDAPGDMRGIVEVVGGKDVRHVADNAVTAGFLGLTPEALRNKLASELGEPEEILRRWIGYYDKSRRTGGPVQFEYADRRGEKEAWLSATVNYLGTNPAGEPRFAYVVRDITDRRQVEEALRGAELRYRMVAENTYDWEFWLDPEGRFLYCSPSCERITGHRSGDFLADPGLRLSLIHPGDRPAFEAHERDVEGGRRVGKGQWRFLRPDGTSCWVEHVCQPIFGERGEFLGTRGSNRDVTDRKLAEEALHRSSEWLGIAQEAAHTGFWYWDIPARRLTWSAELYRLFGLDPSTTASFDAWTRAMHEDDRGDALDKVNRAVEERSPLVNEYRIIRPDGQVRWIGAWGNTRYDTSGKPLAMSGVCMDISDRRKAEERITHLASFPELNPNPILELDSSGEVIYANPAAMKSLEALGLGNDPSLFLPGDLGAMLPRVMEGDIEEEVRVGERVFLETLTLNPLARTQRIYARDITDRKKAEEAMRETSQYLENLLNYANAPIIVWDPEFRITRFNHAFEQLTGRTAEEVIGEGLEILFPPETAAGSLEHIRRVMTGERWEAVEIPILHRDGSIRTVLWNSATLYEADGMTVSSAIAQGQDITDRKQFEEALHGTSQYLENLINHANAPIIVWDPEFRITRFNHAFERLTGRRADEVIGLDLEILFPPETVEESMDLIRRAMAGERWETVEIPILNVNGEVRTVLWNSATLYEADGMTVSSAIAQGQDITDRKKAVQELAGKAAELAELNAELSAEIAQRKKAEEEARKTLSILNAALESTADALLVVDRSGRISSYNRNFTMMWNIPESVLRTLDTRDATGHLAAQMDDPDGFSARMEEILDHPQRESYDMLDLLDGRIIERYSKPQRIGGATVGRVFSFRDITEQKKGELRLIQSLDEKEVLLREIHHRVKNNLQLTTSLLDMTRMRTTDPGTAGILTDVMMKIQTMAQIHTRLYESKQFDRIDMDGQIRDQIRAIANIYSSGDREIAVGIESPALYLPLDQAIPCALALNEVLSNAFKHAFRGRQSGTVKFRARAAGGRIRFTVTDDGVGLPPGFDLGRANTLGLKLVRTLVEQQLRGALRMKRRKKGTEVVVEIPEKREE